MSSQELKPENVTVIIDNREQLPFTLAPMKTVRGTIQTGDYGILGLENRIAVERKSLDDLCGVVGVGRERFEREIQRLLAYEVHAIVVEASWIDIEAGMWRSKVTSAAVMGSLMSWQARGVNILMAGRRDIADRLAARLLFSAARQRWRELQSFLPHLKIAT